MKSELWIAWHGFRRKTFNAQLSWLAGLSSPIGEERALCTVTGMLRGIASADVGLTESSVMV